MSSKAGSSERVLVIALIVIGAYHLALGALMVLAPDTFFEEIGPFGAPNDHYIRDVATYNLAAGAVALVAIRRPSWRLPVLVFLVLQFALHTINHLVDIDEADPEAVGVFDFASLAIATALLALLITRARERVPHERGAGR